MHPLTVARRYLLIDRVVPRRNASRRGVRRGSGRSRSSLFTRRFPQLPDACASCTWKPASVSRSTGLGSSRGAETPTLLNRAPSMDGVVEEHPAHRPEPRSRLGKLAPRPEDPGQGDGGGGEPDDHPDDQNPWRGRDDARNGDAQPEVPESKCPDGLLQCRLVRSPASSSTPNGLLGVVYGHVLPAADPDGEVVTRRTLCIISRPARGLGAASDESNDAQAR